MQGVEAWFGSHSPTKTLPLVIWRRDAFVTYLPFQLQLFAAVQFVERGDRLGQEPEHVTTFEYFELILKLSNRYQLRSPQGDDYITFLNFLLQNKLFTYSIISVCRAQSHWLVSAICSLCGMHCTGAGHSGVEWEWGTAIPWRRDLVPGIELQPDMYELRLMENVTDRNTSQDGNGPCGRESIMKSSISSLILNFGSLA